MMRIATFVICLVAVSHVHAGENEDLSSLVRGLKDSRRIVTGYKHPVVYLCSLKVPDPAAALTQFQRHQLARQLLDVHHLCMALSHQSYRVDPAKAPILELAEEAFPGFRRLKGEGGYRTSDIAEFFEKNGSLWAP